VIGGTSAGAAAMSTPMLTGDERAPGGARVRRPRCVDHQARCADLGASNVRMQVSPAGSTFEAGTGTAHLP
jgi:cyanophycinase-like exopeptidase